MRLILIPLVAAALGAGAVVVASPSSQAMHAAADQAAFEKEVAGLTPGKPQDCIDTRFQQASLKAIGSKLLYRVSPKLVYVNETAGGCEAVARGDALITRQYSTQVCRGDIARTRDMTAGIETGSCALGSFTPYRAQ